MACSNSIGSIKLPLVFIHKSTKPPLFLANRHSTSLPVDYYSQKYSWMDSAIFKKWLFDKFIPKCHHSQKEMGLSQMALLENIPCTKKKLDGDDINITKFSITLNIKDAVLLSVKC